MTQEEQQAADAAKAKAEAEAGKKTYSEEQMKELIAERDKAKEKLRKIDEEKKKLDEQRLVDEGKTKELLTQRESELLEARKKAEKLDTYEKTRREILEGKLLDDDKPFTSSMDLDTLEKFVEKQSKQSQHQQHSTEKWKPGSSKQKPVFKTAAENAKWLKEQGLAVE